MPNCRFLLQERAMEKHQMLLNLQSIILGSGRRTLQPKQHLQISDIFWVSMLVEGHRNSLSLPVRCSHIVPHKILPNLFAALISPQRCLTHSNRRARVRSRVRSQRSSQKFAPPAPSRADQPPQPPSYLDELIGAASINRPQVGAAGSLPNCLGLGSGITA